MQSKIWNTCCNLWEYHIRAFASGDVTPATLFVDACERCTDLFRQWCVHIALSSIKYIRWMLAFHLLSIWDWVARRPSALPTLDSQTLSRAEVKKKRCIIKRKSVWLFMIKLRGCFVFIFLFHFILVVVVVVDDPIVVESVLNTFLILMRRQWIQY